MKFLNNVSRNSLPSIVKTLLNYGFRSPKSRSSRKRSKSPDESAFGTSRREDCKSWDVEKRRKNRVSRSRSKSPTESKKSNQSKLKLVDY